jgi:hypothetical protein
MAKRRTKKPVMIGSARELAKLLGRSNVAVSGWLKHAAWTFGAGPWAPSVVPKIRAWAAATLNPDPAAAGQQQRPIGRKGLQLGDLSPRQQADVALKLLKVKREQFHHDQEQQLFHRADQCERDRVQRVRELRDAFLAFELRLSRILANRPEDVVRQILHDEIRALLYAFARGEPWPPADPVYPEIPK